MTETTDAIRQATSALATVARVVRGGLTDAELVELLALEQGAARYLEASQVLTAGEVAERSRYELGADGLSMRYSERKPVNFIEQVTRVSQSEAARRVRIGGQVRSRVSMLGERMAPQRPSVADAMISGSIGIDTAFAIMFALEQAASGSEATPDAMDAAELALVKLGATHSADLVADAGRAWRDALDPSGVEPRFEEIRERRMLTVGRERNGIKKYTILADPSVAAVLDAALLESMDPKVGPRFLSDDDLQNAATELVETPNGPVERIVDPRSLVQRQLEILEGVLLAGLRATRDGEPSFRSVGSVTAIIQLKDLEAGTGFGILEGSDEVVPASFVQEMACDSGYFTVLLGPSGEPLHHGMLKRFFTAAQRRAMIARDGDRCIAKGCKARAASCHAHHVIFHANGGATDVENGVLLCPAHHHALHQGAFEIQMRDGMPYIRDSIDSWDDSAWSPASRNRLLVAGVR